MALTILLCVSLCRPCPFFYLAVPLQYYIPSLRPLLLLSFFSYPCRIPFCLLLPPSHLLLFNYSNDNIPLALSLLHWLVHSRHSRLTLTSSSTHLSLLPDLSSSLLPRSSPRIQSNTKTGEQPALILPHTFDFQRTHPQTPSYIN